MNGEQKPQGSDAQPEWQNKPADNPPSLSEPAQRPVAIPPIEPRDVITPTPSPSALPQPASLPMGPAEELASQGFYHADDGDDADFDSPEVFSQSDTSSDVVIDWVSSGDQLQSRSAAWRIRMSLISIMAGAVIYLITRDYVSSGSVVVVGLLFGILGSRKPPALQYKLDKHGIAIGQRPYSYAEFRAFSISEDPQSPSINFVPLKRFAPMLSVHYEPQQADAIVDLIAQHLPMEEHHHDAFDSIINRVKF
jgi:hypothetical protein